MARPGFTFLLCDDSELLKEEIEKQIKTHTPEAAGWKRLVFWGHEEPEARFWSSLDQTGLFAEKRIIIVRKADQWLAPVWQEISGRLSRAVDHVWPFFCLEMGPDNRGNLKIPAHISKQACYEFASKRKWISQGSKRSVRDLINREAKARGLTFEKGAFEKLAEALKNSHLTRIVTELDKLTLLADNGAVTPALVNIDQEEDESAAFGIVNAIRAGDLPTALTEAAEDAEGSRLFFTIALLANDLRKAWRNLPGGSLNPVSISRGFAALADAEYQVKSGRLSPGQSLEVLCREMTRIYRAGR